MTKYAHSESQKRRDIFEQKDQQMETAMAAYQAEQLKDEKLRKSIRRLALEFGVPHSTLSDRINGKPSMKACNMMKQKLTVVEEAVLAKLVSISSDRGCPFDHRTITCHANKIIQSRLGEETFEPVGNSWVFNFLERHRKAIKSYWSKALDTKRAQGLNPNAVNDWFNILQSEITDKGVLPEDIYAMDESGFPPENQGTQRVIGTVGKKLQYKQGNANRENVTAIVTICADGSNLTPLIVYKAANLMTRWTHDNVANARYAPHIANVSTPIPYTNVQQVLQFQRTVGLMAQLLLTGLKKCSTPKRRPRLLGVLAF